MQRRSHMTAGTTLDRNSPCLMAAKLASEQPNIIPTSSQEDHNMILNYFFLEMTVELRVYTIILKPLAH